MATNLDPDSSLFTTLNMLDKGNEDGVEEFFNNVVENTGFNWLGMTNKPKVSFGRKTGVSPSTPTTVTFSSDKLDGVSSFTSGSSYIVLLNLEDGTTTSVFELKVASRTTTTFDIDPRIDVAGTDLVVYWLAFGW